MNQRFKSDKKLVEEILKGDKKLLRRTLKEYRPRIFRFISHYVEAPEDAEEILQETLLSVVDSLPLYSGKSRLFTWICAIARHEISDFYRKRKIKSVLFSRFPKIKTFASQALGPEEVLEKKELGRKVKKTLASLSEGYVAVLRLKYIEGKSVAQIARELGESTKAVESRLFRARQAFIKLYVGS